MKYIYIDTTTGKVLSFSDTPNQICNIPVADIPDDFKNYYYRNDELVYDDSEEKTVLLKEQYTNELNEIKVWFYNTDYIPNKIITGEWNTNDERWISYLSERSIKRARQDELLGLLES